MKFRYKIRRYGDGSYIIQERFVPFGRWKAFKKLGRFRTFEDAQRALFDYAYGELQ